MPVTVLVIRLSRSVQIPATALIMEMRYMTPRGLFAVIARRAVKTRGIHTERDNAAAVAAVSVAVMAAVMMGRILR